MGGAGEAQQQTYQLQAKEKFSNENKNPNQRESERQLLPIARLPPHIAVVLVNSLSLSLSPWLCIYC